MQPRFLPRRRFGLLLAIPASIGLSASPAAPQTATYQVTFEGNWTLASTPGGVVGGAHFTTLIGGVHGSGVTFWQPGAQASAGVENVAELGATGTFRSEVQGSSHTRSVIEQSVSGGGTGTATFTIEVTTEHPQVTLLSMIGPSPDWFVGVSGESLLDGSGQWVRSLEVDLFPYDAGTEDGTEFSLSNPATSPQGVITRIAGTGKFSNVRMARLTFTNLDPPPPNTPSGPEVSLSASPNPVDEGQAVTVTARLSQALSNGVTIPLDLASGTAESDDFGSLESITVAAGETTGSGTIPTVEDADNDDETFTVSLGQLPPEVTEGDPSFVEVTIIDSRLPPNIPPTVRATCDPCTVPRGGEVRLTAEASDPDGDPISYEWEARRGTFTGPTDRQNARWTAPERVGTVVIRVEVTDGRGGRAVAEVPVRVANRPPVFGSSLRFVIAENRDGSSTPITIGRVRATDPDGDDFELALASGNDRFVLDATSGALSYIGPGEDFEAEPNRYPLTVTATDSLGGAARAEVVVSVVNVNERPVAMDDALSVDEDRRTRAEVLANDEDPDRGDRLRVIEVATPAHGQTRIVDAGAAVQYAPDPNYHGPDRFTYVVADAGGLADTATVEVTVTPVNDAPEAGDDQATTLEDEAVEIAVLDNDTDLDGDELRVSSVSSPENGAAEVAADGTNVSYVPDPNYHGLDRFTYVVADAGGLADTATVEVTVTPVNDAPEATDDQVTTLEDEAIEIAVLDNDTDLDGDRLRVRSVSPPGHGEAEIPADGSSVSYVPDPNYHGPDRFTYVVADPDGLADTASVEVTVVPVNDGPAAVGEIPDQLLDEGGDGVTVELTPFFTDIDGDPLVFSAESSSADVVTAAVTGSSLRLLPVVYGDATVIVTATDPGGLAATQRVTVGVSDRAGRAVLNDALAATARSYLSSARMTLERRVAPGADPGSADAGRQSGLRVGGRSVALPGGLGDALGDGLRDGHDFWDAAKRIVSGWLPDPRGMWDRATRARYAPDTDLSPSDLAPTGASNPLNRLRPPAGISATDFTFGWGGQSADSARPAVAWSLWGQTDVQRYGGGETELGSGLAGISGDYDGDLRIGYLGLDARLPHWLFGVAVGRSRAASDWNAGTASGRLSTSMTSMHPYLRWSSGATAIWTTFGAGRGEARNERTATGRTGTSPLDLAMGLVDFRRQLGPAGGPVAFGLRADAGWASLSTGEGTETVDDLRGRVHQARLGLDLRSELRVGGAALAPFGAVHLRGDGGDGRTGRGMELSGGLRAQIGIVGVDMQGRWLAFHSATSYSESGAGLTLTVGGREEEGFSLSASPHWGGQSRGGFALWQDRPPGMAPGTTPGMTPGLDAPAGWTMDVRGAYRSRLGGRVLEVATVYDRTSGGQRLQLMGQIGLALADRVASNQPHH
ncbi:MAG: tandem-95 repeat protein [Gemmatimonadetes bacterium]|nr:tandem-95 repeat protein [Gemmatimonadota bacterium]